MISGSVVSTNGPVAAANVTVNAADGESRSTTTHTDGAYQFDFVPMGPATILAAKASFQDTALSLSIADTTSAQLPSITLPNSVVVATPRPPSVARFGETVRLNGFTACADNDMEPAARELCRNEVGRPGDTPIVTCAPGTVNRLGLPVAAQRTAPPDRCYSQTPSACSRLTDLLHLAVRARRIRLS
jgi:hypothetical protein